MHTETTEPFSIGKTTHTTHASHALFSKFSQHEIENILTVQEELLKYVQYLHTNEIIDFIHMIS